MHRRPASRLARTRSALAAISLAAVVPAALGGQARSGPLRELSTDRPDATESPFTVDAGHVQLELDAGRYMRDRSDGVRTTEWVVAPFNLRFGLTADVEAGIFVVPHVRLTEQARGGPRTTVRGVGDVILRTKRNLSGNDGGPFALGVMADLKLPTAADGIGNDKVEGAVAVPVAYELTGGWEGAAMTSVALAYTGAGRRAVWINTLTFGHDLAPGLGGFFELASAAGDGAHVATLNCGLTRRVGPGLQLDCGVNLGLSRAAPDLGVFAGLARKF